MKKRGVLTKRLDKDKHLSAEMEEVVREMIFLKCSILEDHYLEGFSIAGSKIIAYLQWLRENVTEWKGKYADWADTWIREVKPYIGNNFTHEETWTKSTKKGFGNLYDCLHYVAKYLDLHNE